MEEGPIISIQIHCEQVFRALQLASSKGGLKLQPTQKHQSRMHIH